MKTKQIEVWYLQWVYRPVEYPDELKVHVCRTEHEAHDEANRLEASPANGGQWTCIRVTGPHQHTVPA
jgi:hypothetical protein